MPPRVLPAWPHLLFGVLEPIALVWAAYTVFSSPQDFNASHVPSTGALPPLSAGSTIVTLELGNVFLLLAGIAVLCVFTSHPDIAKGYLMVLACGDTGHILANYAVLESAFFWNPGGWNDMAWGNIGVSVFLCINRIATVLGVFGKIGRKSKAA